PAAAYALALVDLLWLAGTEIEPAQGEPARIVLYHGHQLAAGPELHLAVQDLAFYLARLAGPQRCNGLDAGFIFVAQRQMNDEILLVFEPKTQETPLRGAERVLRFAVCSGSAGLGLGLGHGCRCLSLQAIRR